MKLKSVYLSGTTAADGSLTVNDTRSVFGLLEAVQWVDGTFDNGVDFVLSSQSEESAVANTLLTVANADDDAWYYPRQLFNAMADGAALTGTAGGDRTKPIINGTLRLAVTSGGNVKTGGAVVYYWAN